MKRLVLIAFAWLAVAGFALAQEPVCEWSMFESGTAILNTGTAGESGNLTLAEGAELSDDVPTVNTGGHALRLDGGEPTAAAESAAFFDPLAGAEKFTIMAWIRRESEDPGDNTNACIFSDVAYIDGPPCGVEFRFNRAQGNLYLRVNGSGGSLYAAGIPADNWTWRHVAVSCDMTIESPSANTHFYIDGIQVGAGVRLYQQLDGPAANNVPVTIGNSASDRSTENQLVGSIDDVFVFRDWAPEPSGQGNLNTAIRDWMLLDDADRIPEVEPEPEEEEEDEHIVPPVIVEDLIAQKIGLERQYEDLPEGMIFVDAESGELFFVNEENPHGRMVCTFKGLPDWHSFTNTVRLNGNRLDLNNYYSMMAESHALSVRYGTNTIWTAVGEEWGDLAGLTVSGADEHTLMLSCNAVGDGVVLQVCTNLMEANPWRPATNMEVVAETDVATTWRVHLMMDLSAPEFYRVLHNGPSVAAGFHIYPELHAHGGIEVGGTTVTNLDILATTNAVNAVSDELAAHKSASNPHHITAAGIGALTAETDAAALAALGTHTARTDNPHGVTLVQAYDADPDGAADELGISISGGDGISELKGFSHRISFEEGLAEGNFDFDTRPTYAGTNLATTAEVASVSASVSAVSDRVSAIEADYVQAADIEVFATTQAVASVERRTGELESNAEEYWCKWDASILSDSTTNWIPLYDDWPARNITCFLSVGQMTNCVIAIPWNLKPEKDCHLRFVVSKTSTGNSGVGSLQSADGSEICSMGSGYNYRVWLLEWQSAITNWCVLNYTLNTRPYSVRGATMINYGYYFPADRFSPVTGNEPGME